MSKAKKKIGIVLLIGVIAYFLLKKENKEEEGFLNEVTTLDSLEKEEQKLYGFPIDSFIVFEEKLKPNQFLAEILLKHHIPYPQIDKIAKNSKEVFDIKRLAAGKQYAVLCNKDSLQKGRYFIYEINAIDYVVFDLTTATAEKHKKEVVTKLRSVGGVIKSSLYNTMYEIDVNPILSSELADIYAWSIDFYRVQKGDEFKVVYEEQFVEDKSVGIGNIKYAYFKHSNEDFYAIYFEQDDIGDYYDQENKSLRKAFLKAPLKFSRISSRYTKKRFHPVQKRWKAHLGTDYAAPTGTPIMSVADGTVIAAKYGKYNGNFVKIKHNGTYTTQYLHMSKIKSGIKKGIRVRQGDVIGYVGSTGLATGPHLCYRFWKNNKQVDPYKVKMPASKPINPNNISLYSKIKEKAIQDLNAIKILNL